ncbi:hypothetical protein CPB85DRAFT_1432998 [Mucidula mucida]|nr:hypothetical protein CPB85DRAFT_1432998 [Mucidula mucida]
MFFLVSLHAFALLPASQAQKPWFSFGDSYTQTGFNLTTGPLPSVGNPLGNPTYPGWTSSGGENWVDFLTTTYNTSLVFTYNLAYGGATIDANLVAPYTPSVLSLTDQVNDFLDSGSLIPSWSSEDTLFSFWIGINDLGNSYYLGGDRDVFSDTLLDAYFALIDKLVIRLIAKHFTVLMLIPSSATGARNFLFVNVPPTDRSPLMLGQSTDAQALLKSTIQGFNTKLAARAQALEANSSGVQTWVWDSNALFTTILDDPTSYGFTDVTTYGDSPDLFWINDLHPTRYVHKFIAEDLAEELGGFI